MLAMTAKQEGSPLVDKDTAADLPPGPEEEAELIREAYTDLFGHELAAGQAVASDYDPSWVAERT